MFEQNNVTSRVVSGATVSRFLSRVYAWMTFGLIISSVTAYVVSSDSGLWRTFLSGPGFALSIVLQFALVLGLTWGLRKMSVGLATACFLLYSFVTGVTLSSVFLKYDLGTIGQVFTVTAATFGVTAVYGLLTKKDLSAMGSFMIMGLFGVIIASIVNMFLKSSAMDYITSLLSVVIFSGLTAWDVQKLKAIGASGDIDSDESHKYAILGALTLYLDFINLFLSILRLMGGGSRSRN